MTRPRLLITGASGFLGWHLCQQAQHQQAQYQQAQPSWQVHGTYCHHPLVLPGVQSHAIDLTDADTVQIWLERLAPDAVIHTAALSQPNRCEQEPDRAYAINVEATRTLAQYCGDRHLPFVFTSTDQVFDGRSAPYCEDDRPQPINRYGQHKAIAEALIQEHHPQAVICRLPLLYGPPSPTAESFLQGFIRTLRAQQPLHLFMDEFRSPAYVEDVATGLLLALEKGSGILHLSGPDRLSRYEFGLILVEVFGLARSLLIPCQQADVPMPAPRPADVSSGHQRATVTLGYHPRSVREALVAMREAGDG